MTPDMVLTMLANGAGRDAILETYPVLEPLDIDACLLYAARLSEVAEEHPVIHYQKEVKQVYQKTDDCGTLPQRRSHRPAPR